MRHENVKDKIRNGKGRGTSSESLPTDPGTSAIACVMLLSVIDIDTREYRTFDKTEPGRRKDIIEGKKKTLRNKTRHETEQEKTRQHKTPQDKTTLTA